MDLNKFADAMDELITKNHIQLIVDSPEGTQEVTVEDNMHLGGATQFFFLLKAMTPIWKDIYDVLLDHDDNEEVIDGLLKLLKHDMMEVTKEDK